MSTRLYVRLERDTAVPATRCEWILRDARGAELRRGHDRIESLPRADAVIGVLAHELALIRAVVLPPGRRARTAPALASAIEPFLLSDPRANHVVELGKRGDETVLAAIARAWLDACMATFERAGRSFAKLIIESALVTPPPATCIAVCRADGGFCVGPDALTFALDAASAADIPAGLASYLKSTPAVRSLNVHHEHAPLALATWQRTLSVAITDAGRWDWASATDPANGFDVKAAPDLLIGIKREHAGAQSTLTRWRIPLVLTGVIATIHIGATATQWWLRSAERSSLREQMSAQFRRSVSASEPLVEPVLQTKRALAAAQRQAGQYASEDFLSLLGRIASDGAGLPAASLHVLSYQAGALTCEWRGAPAAALERLAVQLRARGMRVDVAADTASTRLTVRAQPE